MSEIAEELDKVFVVFELKFLAEPAAMYVDGFVPDIEYGGYHACVEARQQHTTNEDIALGELRIFFGQSV